MTVVDPTIPDDTWGTFDCVACGLTVHTIQPTPEARCLTCQFISECDPADQDDLRRRLVHGEWAS
jgi:hypothetical protein